MWTRRRPALIVIAFLSLTFTMTAFLGGFFVAKRQIPPYHTLASLEDRGAKLLRDLVGGEEPPPRQMYRESLVTTLVKVEAVGGMLPVTRQGSGGALTSFGEDVLVLTHDGLLYAASSPDDVRLLDVEMPDHGFTAYERFAEADPSDERHHVFPWFRYNDIKLVQTPDLRALVLSYTEFHEADNCYGNTVTLLRVPAEIRSAGELRAAAGDWEIVFRTSPCLPLKESGIALEGHMAGGRMAVGPSNTIFLGNGTYYFDYGSAEEVVAQRPDTDYGKVVQLDLVTGEARHVSIGHRNIQGIAFDSSGALWATEHGPRGGDELNRIEPGENYGWPLETLGTDYSGLPMPLAASYGAA